MNGPELGTGQPGARARPEVPRPWPRLAAVAGVAGAVITCDQLAKSWALDHLRSGPRHIMGPVNLVLTFNKGAAFSIGAGLSPVVEAVAVTVVVILLVASRRLARRGAALPVTIGLGLLSGGALSNLADRFVRHHHGSVVDFIQLVSWWPVFNLADAAITLGAVAVAVSMVFAPAVAPSGEPASNQLTPGLRTSGPLASQPASNQPTSAVPGATGGDQ